MEFSLNGSVGQNSGRYEFYVVCSSTIDVVSNTSTIVAALKLKTKRYKYSGNTTYSLLIDGIGVNVTNPVKMTHGDNKTNVESTICTLTRTVPHNDDGSKTVHISASLNAPSGGYGPGYCSIDGYQELETIARKTTLNSVTSLAVDSASEIVLSGNTKSDAFSHSLEIWDGSTHVVTIWDISRATVDSGRAPLPQDKKNQILSYMAQSQGFEARFKLVTWGNQNGSPFVVGDDEKRAWISVYPESSGPLFSEGTALSYRDTNEAATALTGSNQVLIQGQSRLEMTIPAATARNGAGLFRYQAEFAGQTQSGGQTLTFSDIAQSGTLTARAEAVDTRGFETGEQTKTITVLPYHSVALSQVSARRVNEVESRVQLRVSGSLSPLLVNGEDKNPSVALRYCYRAGESGDFSEWVEITPVLESGNFSFAAELAETYDAEKNYQIKVEAADTLTTASYTAFLPLAMPLMAFRAKKVGINKPNPEVALDINGGLQVDGKTPCMTTDYDPRLAGVKIEHYNVYDNGGFGRTICFDTYSPSGDKYYLAIDSDRNLYVGFQNLGTGSISWTKK